MQGSQIKGGIRSTDQGVRLLDPLGSSNLTPFSFWLSEGIVCRLGEVAGIFGLLWR